MEQNEEAADILENASENPEFSEDTMELPEEPPNDNSVDQNSEKENQVVKRRSSGSGQPKRKRHKSINYNFTNPLMKLNEVKPGLKFTLESQEGPPHNPVFCVSVEVDEQKFYGKGNSKQKAKHDAAKQALLSFTQFKNTPLEAKLMSSGTCDENFTSSDALHSEITNGTTAEKSTKLKKNKTQESILEDIDKKNPCMVLNSIQPGLLYILKQETLNNPNKRFQMSVFFEGETYDGFGPNKKSAKAAAARAVLAQKFNINFNTTSSIISSEMDENDKEVLNFPQNVADSIGKAVFDKFSEVMSFSPEYAKWKVLAGIVMSEDENMEKLHVISLGTGRKNLNGQYMSMTGSSLNDCHAAILSRRCLKEYFYTQLELHILSKGDESVFERRGDKFVLKSNYRFHLYISTIPCGDARCFSAHEDIGKTDVYPNRKANGLLRTKIESGDGTIPIKIADGIQTWDSIFQGQQRYLTMSCSDKIASWNVLGLQGCLLSNFVEPVYLHSIVLGGLFHPSHMCRAIFKRFEDYLKDLPKQYSLNKPKLCVTSNIASCPLTISPNFGVNWTVGSDRPEVITTRIGTPIENEISKISKAALFRRYKRVHSYFHSDSKLHGYTYADVKQLVLEYRKAKSQMILAFSSGGCGNWVTKPAEQDYFTVSD